MTFSENFTAVQQVFVSPNPQYAKPRYRCLEDYATYYQHDVGTDGRENMSAPLIAELLDMKSESTSPDLSTWKLSWLIATLSQWPTINIIQA